MENHYDPNQPRVPIGHHGGGRWTSRGSFDVLVGPSEKEASGRDSQKSDTGTQAEELISKPARLFRQPAPTKTGRPIGDPVTAFFAWLSARNTIDQRAVLTVESIEYARKGEGNEFEAVRLLNRTDAAKVCEKLNTVQRFVDDAAYRIDREKPTLRLDNPTQYGKDVHREVYLKIKGLGDPNFRSEVPMDLVRPPIPHANDNAVPSDKKDAKAPKGPQVRPDSFEYVPDDRRVCLYETVTGERDKSRRTLAEYTGSALKHFPHALWVVVTQVRPTPEYVRSLPTMLYGHDRLLRSRGNDLPHGDDDKARR